MHLGNWQVKYKWLGKQENIGCRCNLRTFYQRGGDLNHTWAAGKSGMDGQEGGGGERRLAVEGQLWELRSSSHTAFYS